MGLGPLVCEKCMVIYDFKHSYGWECPICKTNSPNHFNLWSMQSDFQSLDELTEKLKANKRFYEFMMKEDGGDVSPLDGQS